MSLEIPLSKEEYEKLFSAESFEQYLREQFQKRVQFRTEQVEQHPYDPFNTVNS